MAKMKKASGGYQDAPALTPEGVMNNKYACMFLVPVKGSIQLKTNGKHEKKSIYATVSKWNNQEGHAKGMHIRATFDRDDKLVTLTDITSEEWFRERRNNKLSKGVRRQSSKEQIESIEAMCLTFRCGKYEYQTHDKPMTTEEVADFLKKTPNCIHCMAKRGQLPHGKLGHRNIYSLKVIMAVCFNVQDKDVIITPVKNNGSTKGSYLTRRNWIV